MMEEKFPLIQKKSKKSSYLTNWLSVVGLTNQGLAISPIQSPLDE